MNIYKIKLIFFKIQIFYFINFFNIFKINYYFIKKINIYIKNFIS